MPHVWDELDGLSEEELRRRLAQVVERLAAMRSDDPERGRLSMERMDVAAALRRLAADVNGQMDIWAERAIKPHDRGRPYIASHGEGGGVSGD